MFYIFHGDDAHSQREKLIELTSKLGDPSMLELNTTRFGASVAFGELRQACDSMPFLSKRRLVIVEGAMQNPGQTFIDQLLDYLPLLPDSTRLFFLESQPLRRNHRLLTFAEQQKNGYVREFARPEGRLLERWIERKVQEKGGTIAPRAIHVLVTSIGNELSILENEIEKLVLYKGETEPITADDVTLLCPYAAEASIFDLVDALGSRSSQNAAVLLQHKLNEGTDPYYLFAMIVRQFRLLIQVKELADDGQRPPAISKTLKIHSFVAGKLYQQSQHFTLPQLEHIHAHLLETDVGVKTGQADIVTSLNLLVAALAA